MVSFIYLDKACKNLATNLCAMVSLTRTTLAGGRRTHRDAWRQTLSIHRLHLASAHSGVSQSEESDMEYISKNAHLSVFTVTKQTLRGDSCSK